MAAALPLSRPAPEEAPRPRRLGVGFPLAFAAILATVSLVPYVLAYVMTPPGHHFAGFFFIADDATTYLAKMRQGADGSWLWSDPYTSEPHGGVFLFGFYLLLGHLAALAHIPLVAAYHVARISGGLALVFAVDRLGRRILRPELQRLALVIVVLGSGFGFLVQLAGNPGVFGQRLEALDLHLPEITGWYSILAIPHFAWATAFILLSLVGLLAIAEHPRVQVVIGTGASLLALSAIHPQMVAVILGIWCMYRLVLAAWGRRPSLRSLIAEAGAFALAVPLLAYNAWILLNDPTIASWAQQWRHQAPNLPSLVVSLGLPLIGAAYGAWLTWRRRDTNLALLMVWLPLVLVLLYLPNLANIQRRLLDAVYVPIGILAAVGLHEVVTHLPRRRGRMLQRVLVPVACLSSGLVLAIALRFATGAFPEAYIDDGRWQAMSWLATNHTAGDRALSSPGSGLFLPAWSGVSVYVGHYSETVDYFKKIATANGILSAGSSALAVESFVRDNRITLLFWGSLETQATGYQPDAKAYWRPIFRNGSVAIYRFQAQP